MVFAARGDFVGGKIGFTLGGAPLGEDEYIKDALRENL